jgi:hypothetical protein
LQRILSEAKASCVKERELGVIWSKMLKRMNDAESNQYVVNVREGSMSGVKLKKKISISVVEDSTEFLTSISTASERLNFFRTE